MTEHKTLTHLDSEGRARMVDVTAKEWTRRIAVARARVVTLVDPARALTPEVLAQAHVAGVGAAKRAWDLIPLCHPIRLVDVDVTIEPTDTHIDIEATTEVFAPTGVEMEALTAAGVAGLVLVGALRRHDLDAMLTQVALWRKEGGRSGIWVRGDS
ncbi:MAG TPA: cyclic pyranopterin monophosphate synthase MoaC [Acidimicrobiales bacterium]|nr:cyclic pyranopterin monophosphate synthase MoaC [Acidimicrobiales bacterium]